MHSRSLLARRSLCALLLLLWTQPLANAAEAVTVTQRYEKSLRGGGDGFPFLLPIIFHVVPPGGIAPGRTPVAVEYSPDPQGIGTRVRGPSPDAPTSLSIANHFVQTAEELFALR